VGTHQGLLQRILSDTTGDKILGIVSVASLQLENLLESSNLGGINVVVTGGVVRRENKRVDCNSNNALISHAVFFEQTTTDFV
jgi:hypothetical protein